MGAPTHPFPLVEPISVVPNPSLERWRCPLIVGIRGGSQALSCGTGPEPQLKLEVTLGGVVVGVAQGGGHPEVGEPRGGQHKVGNPRWVDPRWTTQGEGTLGWWDT